MKLLAFGDLHGDVAAAERLAATARRERADAIVSAGDVALDGLYEEAIYALLAAAGLPVLGVSGNHEDERHPDLLRRHGWSDLDGAVHQVGDLHLAGWGARHLLRLHWSSHLPEQEEDPALADLAARARELPASRLVVVSHLPPHGSRAADDEGTQRGSAQLAAWVRERRPVAVICGHVHRDAPTSESFEGVLVVSPGPGGLIVGI